MAPPPPAVWLGKRQMLPNPMADPAAAATIPIFDTNVTLFSSILVGIVFLFQSPFETIFGIFYFESQRSQFIAYPVCQCPIFSLFGFLTNG